MLCHKQDSPFSIAGQQVIENNIAETTVFSTELYSWFEEAGLHVTALRHPQVSDKLVLNMDFLVRGGIYKEGNNSIFQENELNLDRKLLSKLQNLSSK